MPVPGPSIIPVDNDPNWKDAPTNPIINNNTVNRPTSSTCSWSKPCWSKDTNKQLADLLTHLILIRLLVPILIQRETKAYIPNTFSGTEPDKLNNFLFQYHLYFYANPVQFDMDIVKINFAMIYLTKVV